MNASRKKLLKNIESRNKNAEMIAKNKFALNENKVSLEQIELRTRKIADELNNIVSLLCKNIAQLSQENSELKNQLKGKKDNNGAAE